MRRYSVPKTCYPNIYILNIHQILSHLDFLFSYWQNTHTFQKRHDVFPKTKTCGKPETPEVGLGDTKTYKNVMYINRYIYISFIAVDINSNALSVLNTAILLPLLLIPSWALAIN